MADVPSAVKYGQVKAHMVSFLADGGDAGEIPDEIPLSGVITLTPQVDRVKWPTTIPPRTAIIQSLRCPLIAGWLYPPGTPPEGPLPGTPGVVVVATDQPGGVPSVVQWTASFALEGVKNQPNPLTFNVPANGVVDLTTVMPATPDPGTVQVTYTVDRERAEAAADVAEGFAGDAETARDQAVTAAAALQDTGWRDVSSLLINGWTAFAGQNPRIRRTNGGLVFLKGLIKPPPLGEFPETRFRALEIPIGFRPDFWNEYMPPIYTWDMPATVLPTRIYDNFLQVEAADTNKFAGVGWAIGGLFWFTGDPWPTTLPGTPA